MKINPADCLTFARIFLVLPVLHFLLRDCSYFQALTLFLFVIASLTDFFDGYLARLLKTTSTFGKFLDPLADKILVISVLLGLAVLGQIPLWMVLTIIFREAAVTFLRAGDIEKYTPGILAKCKTTVQMGAVIILIFLRILKLELGTVQFFSYFIMLGVVAITLISGADYFLKIQRKE